jgi:hypothetical protein
MTVKNNGQNMYEISGVSSTGNEIAVCPNKKKRKGYEDDCRLLARFNKNMLEMSFFVKLQYEFCWLPTNRRSRSKDKWRKWRE